MNALDRLRAAFDAAARAGQPRAVWWRDDDAVRRGPRLDRLARLAGQAGAPLALAVIPVQAEPALGAFCAANGIVMLQHGFAHRNHQRAGKAAELGDARPVATILAECLAARERLRGPAFLPVMVPPWNRMREDLAPALAASGWCGLSRFGASPTADPLRRVDVHLDPIDWHGGRDLLAADELTRRTAVALAAAGPLGLLTHHAVHTPATEAFVEAFVALVSAHPGARWVGARELFAAQREGGGHEGARET